MQNYKRRVIQFIRDVSLKVCLLWQQVVDSAVINYDRDYETSQKKKLE